MLALTRSRSASLCAMGLAAIMVLGVVGTAAVSYVAADRLVHPARELRDTTPASRGLAYGEVVFTAQDGVRLAGWWIPAEDARGTVIFLHGYSASKTQSLSVAPFLHRAGYNVLAFDFRAHGQSEGGMTTIGLDEVEDVRAAVRFVRAQVDGADHPLALLGWSMGGAAALNAAREIRGIDAVVADSAFARLHNIVRNSLTVFTGLPEFPFASFTIAFASAMTQHDVRENQPARSAGETDTPVLLIYGGRDNIARADADAIELAQATGERGELWIVPDATHVDARRAAPREYEGRVVAFLDAHMR